MTRIPGLRRLVHIDRAGAGIDRALDDELQFHFEMTMRELMAGGMNPDDARREAARRFGDVQRTREQLATIDRSRLGRQQRAEWWSGFAQDVRYALRGMRRKPGFAAAVVLTLGLGIGANATMFGIVDRLLFRPPAFLDSPGRASLFYFARSTRRGEIIGTSAGFRQYLDIRENATAFDAMTPFVVNKLAVGDGPATREMQVAASGADLWRLFDAKPVLGRFFTDQEDLPPAGTPVVVLSYAFWQTEFGGRRDVLGGRIDVGAAKYTVIGVAPEGFDAYTQVPVVAFVPISAMSSAENVDQNSTDRWSSAYNITWFDVYGRIKPGVTREAATADLSRAYRASYKKMLEVRPHSPSLSAARPRAIAGPVLHERGPQEDAAAKVATWLAGVAAIVLLIACANVVNLLLARALRRRREIALRIALGVSRARLFMQLVTESVLLAIVGGAAGLAIAQWGGAVLRHALLEESGTTQSTFTDSRTLIVVALLALAAGALTGLAPVFQTRRDDVASALKAGAREGTVHRSKLRSGLLIAQAALSVILLVGAGLFLRSLVNVQNLRMGYDADRLLWVDIDNRGMKTDSAQDQLLRDQLLARAQHLPGVDDAARALTVPFYGTWQFNLSVPGVDSVNRLGPFTFQGASPEFFRTMGTRLLRGRGFTAADTHAAPRVIVVGASMAKRIWPGEDALGKCIKLAEGDGAPCYTVVGIAEDVRRSSVSKTEMHYYVPIDQFQPDGGGLFVRTHGSATEQADQVRRALQQSMPGVSYVTVTPLSTIIAPEIRSWKLGAVMFAAFGALALALAAIGLYGVIAYNVAQRTHEMGVRVALGAQARTVIALVVREGLTVVLPGVVLGTVAALVAGKWVAPLLFQVSPTDPPVIVGVIVTLVAVAAAASAIPAVRAARVDPSEALRAD